MIMEMTRPCVGWNPNRIEAVFLDAAGTLFHVRGSVGATYSRLARRHGVTIDPEELDRDFKRAFALQPPAVSGQAEGPVILEAEKQWWMRVVHFALDGKMPSERFPGYFDEVFEFFRTREAWKLYPDSLEALRELEHLGYRMGIISNFDSRLYDLLGELGIAPYFERVFTSWRVGAAKPDPALFRFAATSMNVDEGSCVHIGDSPEEDAFGAKNAGMFSVLLNRARRHDSGVADLCIENLAELVSLLKR